MRETFDIAIGFGIQLDAYKQHADERPSEDPLNPSFVVSYEGDKSLPTYKVEFRDKSLQEAILPSEQKRQITYLIVHANHPYGEVADDVELDSGLGFPVVIMRLRMDDDNLIALVRDIFNESDITVVKPKSYDHGLFSWDELKYQIDPENNHEAVLVGGITVDKTSLVKSITLQDNTGPTIQTVYGILGYTTREADVEELLQRGAIPRIDWVQTAGMYLTGEMPSGDALTAAEIHAHPVVAA